MPSAGAAIRLTLGEAVWLTEPAAFLPGQHRSFREDVVAVHAVLLARDVRVPWAGYSITSTRYLDKQPRLELLYGARYSPHDNPIERAWGGLKNYVASTAVTWPGRLRQIHSYFRNRSAAQMLDTAAPWTSPWLPPRSNRTFGMPLRRSGSQPAACENR